MGSISSSFLVSLLSQCWESDRTLCILIKQPTLSCASNPQRRFVKSTTGQYELFLKYKRKNLHSVSRTQSGHKLYLIRHLKIL